MSAYSDEDHDGQEEEGSDDNDNNEGDHDEVLLHDCIMYSFGVDDNSGTIMIKILRMINAKRIRVDKRKPTAG